MNKERSVTYGAVVAAFLASLCCIGPLLLAALGVGAFGAAGIFESARPFLVTGAVLLLAVAFYWTYFRQNAECALGEVCATKTISRAGRLGLWIASLAVLGFALMPYVAAPLAAKISERKTANQPAEQDACCIAQRPSDTTPITLTAGMETATFKVKGMTCVSCETTIKIALERTPGVRRANVSYERGEAVVEYDPHQTTPAELRDAINSTGYTVEEGQ